MSRPQSNRSQRHVNDAGCFASEGETDLIGIIEVAGKPGRSGLDGTSFFRPPRRTGANGRRGGDATPAQPGQHACDVHCLLSYDGSDRALGRMTLDGSVMSQSDHVAALEEVIEIDEQGYLFVHAIGGKGGNGGRGGDGQPGATGSRGSNATRYRRGSDGGPGGNGGNAGNPTDGADGGRGGNVTLTVDHNEQGLLMLVKGNLSGGDIGFAGEGGRGGRGGKGGSGGSSYHWTESHSYTDSQGNRRTRTTFHSNPGGSNGRRGRDGAPSAYRARDGKPGDVGALRIFVIDERGQRTEYAAPYDLELVTFDIAPEYEILEPDSLVSLDRIMVRNVGGMPTPENYTVRVFLVSDRWLIHDGVELVMHRAIEPGDSHRFDRHGLRLRVGDYVVDEPRKRPFSLRHTVTPQARMESGIARPFRQFCFGEELEIRFPVELTPITSLNSLAAGESTRMIWAVTNVSSETFDQKYLYRAVRSGLRLLGGDLDSRHVVFFGTDDAEFDLMNAEYSKPVSELSPGDSCVIETRVGIKEASDVVPYQGFSVGVDLHLQRPGSSGRSGEYRCVDYRKTFIRVSERYSRQQSSRFLLIANEKITVNDIDHWTQLADYFGSSLDVWDVSYYGFFDLLRDVEQDESLLEHWRGMTIIVPNNYYQTPNGPRVAFDQLSRSQFLRAAADFDINFYIVGDAPAGGEGMLARSLIPLDDARASSGLTNETEFLREVKRWNRFIHKSKRVVGGATEKVRDFADVSLGAAHEFDIEKRTFLFQPNPKWLEARARRLQNQLRKTDPLHRWIIVHRYNTGDTDTSWGFFRKRQVGKLEVRRTLDSTKGSVVLYEIDSIDAIDENFITSMENKHGIFLALKFEDKVDRFIRLVSERTFPRYSEDYVDRPLTDDEVRMIGQELVDSILVDLYNEQRVAREARTWGRFGVEALLPKLNYLAERSLNYGVTYQQMQQNHVNLELLYDLIANLRYMAWKSKTAWDSAWNPTSLLKRGRAVSTHMNDRAGRIVTSIFGRRLGWWDRVTSSNDDYDAFGSARQPDVEGIERQIADREISSRLEELIKRNRPVKQYSIAQRHSGLTYDPEVLSPSLRVMSGETFDRLVKAEARASRERRETEKAVREHRSELLVPLRRAEKIPTESVSVPTPHASN